MSDPDVTVIRLRRRPIETDAAWGPWESITTGLPLSVGASLSLRDSDPDAAQAMEIELTAATTAVDLFLAGV